MCASRLVCASRTTLCLYLVVLRTCHDIFTTHTQSTINVDFITLLFVDHAINVDQWRNRLISTRTHLGFSQLGGLGRSILMGHGYLGMELEFIYCKLKT
ncbi:hypothetical protein K2173_007257 [Erythroxylum novogranatense]|uniref:Secreted protein n=1 Tax=Erythroxylum novogranatense TaxID=1862640 RepID=A0AAV8UBW6_9ROSI|nr:hypothetical protein K2173_007257 [Erythroxylum novogranatense]